MGNRAVITIAHEGLNVLKYDENEIGVYLHWNGGYDSIRAFLTYCKLKGHRPPELDCYGWARLCQVIGNFFGGNLCIGIDKCCKLDCDNGDNGVYIIKNWKIVDREYYEGDEQNCYDLYEMLKCINENQPKNEQFTEEKLKELFEKFEEEENETNDN